MDSLRLRILELSKEKLRIIVGIAGCPGSGKSTIVASLTKQLKECGLSVAVVPMDGFHHTKAYLKQQPNAEELLARRGAPWTFDAESYVACIKAIHASQRVKVPLFDHCIGDPVEEEEIDPSVQVILTEGNYLLLDQSPWNQLLNFFDIAAFVQCDLEITKQRLINRHLQAGISKTRQEAEYRVMSNDLPNSELILKYSSNITIFI